MIMDEQQQYAASYDLQKVILFGATGSCSLIFSVFFLLFLGSQISSHPGLSTDTINEMVGYAEFFLFAFASYFSASIFVWRFSGYFSRSAVSWMPIALLGSIAFSISFLLRVWVSSILTYQENNPFQDPPPTFWIVAIAMLFCGIVCFIVSAIGCGLVSAIVGAET
jgi:hypothetical protein